MQEIFISYREGDAKPWALLLRDRLAEAFGEQLVYLDKDALMPGSWREQLDEALTRCKAVLVVIGQRWVSAQQPDGSRRLDDPNDVHRREIALALARKGVAVIPVLVDGATMPRAEELPDDIRALSEQQARSIGDRSVHRRQDLTEIIEDIERATGAVAKRPPLVRAAGRSATAWVIGLALIAVSWFIGSEIGSYRYWRWWFAFTFVVPGSVLVYLALPLLPRVRARAGTPNLTGTE